MEADQVSQALNDPQAFLSGMDWLAVAVSLLAGFVAPWICARLLQRKLGFIAYLVIGTMASSVVYGLMQKLDRVFAHSLVLDAILVAFVGLAVMLVLSMRKP
ncbi:MAG: hypothetical protein JWM33_2720 [Caulobacteraceae bacterium]|nr:hypothetical protein [Caulobacteraceae bacterium]